MPESQFAIRVNSVSKLFRKGEVYDSLRDLIPAITGRLFKAGQNGAASPREFWALKDVSFELARGEAFGIVGSNGAGKSTILKLLSRIMKPTSGTIELNGRLSALIEVGAGFHPDLTGRENIFLNGTIMGMRREQIRRKFDEIVQFSGLADFIDTPVKRYSSGMYARLGFSVAAHVEPDILIVDEVLSVGDYVFQRRCAEKMRSVITSGATVIFVSHNLRAVSELCTRSLLLERGRVLHLGPTHEVIGGYLERAYAANGDSGDKDVVITDVRVRSATGPAVQVPAGEQLFVDVEVTARRRCERIAVVLMIQDDNFYEVFNTSTERLGEAPVTLEAGERFSCSFAIAAHLAQGTFHVGAALYRYDLQREYDRRLPASTIFVTSEADVRGVANLYPSVVRALAPVQSERVGLAAS